MRWELFYFNREWTKSWTQLITNLFGLEEKKACKVQILSITKEVSSECHMTG